MPRRSLTLGDVCPTDRPMDLAEQHALVLRGKRLEARERHARKVKALRVKYGRPKFQTKALPRPAKVKPKDCRCGGACDSCQFDKCHHLGEELTKLDLAIALTRQEMAFNWGTVASCQARKFRITFLPVV
jgi:hypothetical protein